MNCIAPEEIREGDLLAYLEGEASPLITSHIADCLFCAGEANGMRQADALLRLALFRQDCPASDDLLLYQAGLLDPAKVAELEAHIDICRPCREMLDQLKKHGRD